MVTGPAVHPPSTTVGALRAFFADEHVHMALLVEDGELLGTVERSDLAPGIDDLAPACQVARLDGRTIAGHSPLADALDEMRRARRRRLAVTSGGSTLLGLLCLKASGHGFCSDADTRSRSSAGETSR